MIYAYLKQDFSRLDRLERGLDGKLDKRVKRIVEAIVTDIDNSWSSSSPSDRGSAPAVVTGNLKDSVVTEQARDDLGRFSSAWKISYTADYAGYLEPPGWLNRPFLLPALERAEGQFPVFFEGVFNDANDGG